jgi:hypothetical protein
MTPYGKRQQEARIEKATQWFTKGRDIPFVKKITGLTLAAMKQDGLIYEIIIPDPKGWSGGNPKTGEGMVHNGQMLHTDKWRPTAQPNQ